MKKNVPRQLIMLSKRLKYVFLIQLFLCTELVANTGNTQRKTIEEVKPPINLGEKSPSQILRQVEARSDLKFTYNDDVRQKVTVAGNNRPLYEMLEFVSLKTKVSFGQINENNPVKSKDHGGKEQAVEVVKAVDVTVSGTVTDANGEPIPGVTISVLGTTIGTATDLDGRYTLTVPEGSTLVFSFIGFKTQSIPIGDLSIIDVELSEDMAALDEIVVVGYGEQKKANLTGAISHIESDNLTRSVSSTVSGALIGKLPGVNTRLPDGRPGGSAQLQIRNMGTPLFIIDGVPATESDFNNIDLNNIENISVLKDASAAIYGLRAGNGVVLVTTKMGAENIKPKININAYYGLQGFTKFPQQANSYQYMRGHAESAQNLNQSTPITQEELDRWKEGRKLPEGDYRSIDYLDYMISPAPQVFINPSATGGSDKFKYHLSLGHLDQRATIESYFFKRSSVQANLEASLAKGLRIGTQVSGRVEHRHQAGVPGDDYSAVFNVITKMWPIERPYANDNPNYINSTHSINVNPATYVEEVTGWNDIFNRVARTNFYAIYDFDFGLEVKGTYSYQYSNWIDDTNEYTYDAYTYDPETDTYNVVEGGGNQNPIRRTGRRNIADNFAQFQVSYNKSVEDHSFSAVLAYEQSTSENRYLFARTVPQTNYLPIMLFEELNDFTDQWTEQARGSYIGRFNYDFNGKYLLELLGRYDGSYLYSKENRWGFFPGISAGWRISDESFFSDAIDVVSDLKLRASYGRTGSETGVSAYGYLGGFNWAEGNYMFDGNLVTGIQPRGLPVTNLSWVTNESTNIGIDISLFQNRLSGQFDVFQRKVTGIPAARYDVLLPSEVGYTLPNENLNSNAILGIEGMILYRGIVRDLDYSVGINGTLARGKTLNTYKPRFGNSYDEYRNSVEERWQDVTWGYHILGQFQSQEEIDNHPVNIDGQGNRSLLPGDLIYEDLNGDKIINAYDEQPIAYRITQSTPYLNVGVNSSFHYKGFNLAMDFSGATMQSFFLDRELRIPFYGNGNSPAWLLEDRWHREDPFDPTSSWVPGTYPAIRKNLNSHSNFNKRNDFYKVNMTYLRLRNFEIGYTFPLNFVNENNGDSTVKMYSNITNLFSIDNVGKRFGIDPEIADFGGRVYPQTRVFNFGLMLSL